MIIVVEDNDDHFVLIKRLLRKTSFADWTLNRAVCLNEAIDLMREHIPALILCDQNLPDSHADDTLTRVIEFAHETTAIVAMTSIDDGPRARAALRAGVQDYLVKGEHDASQLERSLHYALDRKELLCEVQEKNRELENFVRIVSHDLKSPLGAILLELQMLERTDPQPRADVLDAMQHIREECAAMSDIFDSLLAYARAGWIVGDDIQPTCLCEAVRGAMKQLSADIERRRVVVDVGDLPSIMGNTRAVTQIFQNLIGNAIKYNDSEPPRIRISGKSAGDVVRISVADNGLGIAPDRTATVFDMFASFSRNGSTGSGLGLAIVRRLAKLLKGDVSVQSTLGEGSVFSLEFPAVPPALANEIGCPGEATIVHRSHPKDEPKSI